MTTTLESTRLGSVEIPDDAVLEFPSGLVGLPGTRYGLVPHREHGPFLWLQSLEDSDLALPVVSPWPFFPGYELELPDAERERIGLGGQSDHEVLVTVRAVGAPESFTANLRAPLVIVGGRGFQVINETADAPVRAPLFAQPLG